MVGLIVSLERDPHLLCDFVGEPILLSKGEGRHAQGQLQRYHYTQRHCERHEAAVVLADGAKQTWKNTTL